MNNDASGEIHHILKIHLNLQNCTSFNKILKFLVAKYISYGKNFM